MGEYTADDWKRLGRAIKRTRAADPRYRATTDWAGAVGRSSRVVLGLERGEATGGETLMRIEQLLGWPDDYVWRVLDGVAIDVPEARTVGTLGDGEQASELRYRKPEGMSDQQWQSVRERTESYLQGLLDQAATER